MDKAWAEAAKAIRGRAGCGVSERSRRRRGRRHRGDGRRLADRRRTAVLSVLRCWWPIRAARRRSIARKAKDPDSLDRIFQSDGCVVEPGCTLPALRWLFDHEPELMARVRYVLSCKDWLRYRLTGELAADVTEAAVAPGDARARGRSLEMLRDSLGSKATQISCRPSDRPNRSAASSMKRLRLKPACASATPVAIGAGDVPCSAIAAGAVDAGMACSILGTTCHNGLLAKRTGVRAAECRPPVHVA